MCFEFANSLIDFHSFEITIAKAGGALTTKLVTRQLHRQCQYGIQPFDSIPIYGQLIDYAPNNNKNRTVQNQLAVAYHIICFISLLN